MVSTVVTVKLPQKKKKKAIKSHQNYVVMVLKTTTYFQMIVEDAYTLKY